MSISGNLADAFIRIRADLRPFLADIRSARSTIQSSLQGIAATAGGIAAAMGISKIAEAMEELAKSAFMANAEIESFAVNFEVFLGSAAKGNAFLAEFRKHFQDFPNPMGDLIGVGGQLLAIGKRGKEVIEITEAIANAVALGGNGPGMFDRIATNMIQMITLGKVFTKDMNQFATALVPAWKIMSDEMGIPIKKLKEMQAAGELGEDAVAALVRGLGKMGGVTAARMKTAFGMIDILRKRWLLFIEQAGKPIFDNVKAGLQKLIDLTNSKGFKEFTKSLADGMVRLIAVVKEIAASPIFQKLAAFGGLTVVFGSLVGLAIAFKAALAASLPVILPFVAAGAALAAAFALAAKIVKQSFAGPDGEKFRALLAESRDLVVEIAMNLRDNLLPIVNSIAAAFERTFGPGSEVQKGADSLIGNLLTGLKRVLNFASLMTTDFRLTFAYLKSEAMLAWTTIKQNAIVAFADLFKEIRHGAQDIAVHFYALAGTIQAMFKYASVAIAAALNHPFSQMIIKGIGAVAAIDSSFRSFFVQVGKHILSIGKALVKMGVITAVALAKAAKAISPFEMHGDKGKEVMIEKAKKAKKEAEELARGLAIGGESAAKDAARSIGSIYADELAKARAGFDAMNKGPGGVDTIAAKKRKEAEEAIADAAKTRDAAWEAILKARRAARRSRLPKRPPWDDPAKPDAPPDLGEKGEAKPPEAAELGKMAFLGLSELSRRIQLSVGKSSELERLDRIAKAGEAAAAHAKASLAVEAEILKFTKKDRVAKAT